MLTLATLSLTAALLSLPLNHGVQAIESLTMSKVMELKLQGHKAAASESTVSEMESDIQKIMDDNEAREIPCVDGLIAGKFPCKNMNLVSFLTGEQLGSPYAIKPRPLIWATWINDLWGWEDSKTGKEYGLIGMWDGVSIVDLSNPAIPMVVAFLETTEGVDDGLDSILNIWRDIKVIGDVAYIGSAVSFHGIQTFDLTRLRAMSAGRNGTVPLIQADFTVNDVTSSHNIATAEEADYVMVLGVKGSPSTCKKGNSVYIGEGAEIIEDPSLVLYDVSVDPIRPHLARCIYIAQGEIGYVHDLHCVRYHGPDERYTGANICALFMESVVTMFNLDTYAVINTFTYTGASYVHQGWFAEDHSFLYGDDEFDEINRRSAGPKGDYSRTLIWDVSDLEAEPQFTQFEATEDTHPHIDHNLYVRGDFIYQASYTAGARVRRISKDKTDLTEEAFFDGDDLCETVFEPGINCDPFGGTWTHFPFFGSGITLAGSSPQGLFVLRPTLEDIESSGCGSFICPVGTYVGAHVRCLDALEDCFCNDTDDRADIRTECWNV